MNYAETRTSEAKVRRVLAHPGFVEISQWPDLREPWAIGLRLGDDHRITWLHGHSRGEVLGKAERAIELLGAA